MASSWRGYRALVVAGQQFRWMCSFSAPVEIPSAGYARHGDTWPPDTLTVRPEDRPYRLLTVTWPACSGPVVKPHLVRTCVEEALRRGWLTEYASLKLDGPGLPVTGR